MNKVNKNSSIDIKSLRQQLDLTQEELARELGVTVDRESLGDRAQHAFSAGQTQTPGTRQRGKQLSTERHTSAMSNEAQTPQKRAVEKVAADLVAQFVGTTLDVSTGELRVVKDGLLRASAIGSCIAVALQDPGVKIGGLAHVMLPGTAPQRQNVERTRYVDNGIRELLETMVRSGARRERVEACFAGGGNVLEREDETICDANVASTIRTLDQLRIPTKAQDVGGTQRRSMTLDIDAGCVLTTVGDAAPSPLWNFGDRVDKRG